jgi:hypothetical protein
MATYEILILGASYGSLLASKMLFAGHKVTLICLPHEVEAINAEGFRVAMPIKGGSEVLLDSRKTPGTLRAAAPGDVDPKDFDLIALAMQEPQYRSPGVRELLDAVAKSGKPCMSIMNMPPRPYLRRIPGLDCSKLDHCFADASVWANFDPGLMSLCSPDPQAIRPPDKPVNFLQVTLPTNFKAARFVSEPFTQILRQLQSEIESIRYDTGSAKIDLPVKLKVHDSIFVPLAKWPMLITGNYRCVQPEAARMIKEAVHDDIGASAAMYAWVKDVCLTLGAAEADLVPFEKYAAAAHGLVRPSSAARALFAGAPNIERVDRLVQAVAAQQGKANPALDNIVAMVDARLEKNRAAAAAR